MCSKLINPTFTLSRLACRSRVLLVPRSPPRVGTTVRTVWNIPPSQYDMAIPKKMQFLHVVSEYWELIPVFGVTFIAGMFLVLSIFWASRNKVDVVFFSHSRENISRTMDLRNPSVHKVVTINQKCVPWPEMQIVLEKMIAAEKRAYRRSLSCTHP